MVHVASAAAQSSRKENGDALIMANGRSTIKLPLCMSASHVVEQISLSLLLASLQNGDSSTGARALTRKCYTCNSTRHQRPTCSVPPIRHVPTRQPQYTCVEQSGTTTSEMYRTARRTRPQLWPEVGAVVNFNLFPEIATVAARRLLWAVSALLRRQRHGRARVCKRLRTSVPRSALW